MPAGIDCMVRRRGRASGACVTVSGFGSDRTDEALSGVRYPRRSTVSNTARSMSDFTIAAAERLYIHEYDGTQEVARDKPKGTHVRRIGWPGDATRRTQSVP